jgi:2-methylfumaryl-CoA isomerase
VALAAMGNLGFIAEAERGQVRERAGNELFGAFGGDFSCADGRRLMIVALTARQWSALCQALELNGAIAELERTLNLDLSLEGNRYRAHEDIARLVRARLAGLTADQAAREFERCGVCWGRYQTVGELVADDPACSLENPLFGITAQPQVGATLAPTIPLDFAAGGRLRPQRAPQLGEHTVQVLEEVVGLDAAEIRRLRNAKIIAGP